MSRDWDVTGMQAEVPQVLSHTTALQHFCLLGAQAPFQNKNIAATHGSGVFLLPLILSWAIVHQILQKDHARILIGGHLAHS